MKKNKNNEVDFEFDYNNYLEKSSQGRYTELEEEVNNRLKYIKFDNSIPGTNKKEKRKNLLLHYQYSLERNRVDNDGNNLLSVLIAFLVAVVAIIGTWIPNVMEFVTDNCKYDIVRYFSEFAVVITIILALGVIYSYLLVILEKREKKQKQKYLYYKFYTTVLESKINK